MDFMVKVGLFDKRIFQVSSEIISLVTIVVSTAFIFIKIPEGYEYYAFGIYIFILLLIYIIVWVRSNQLNYLSLRIDETNVIVKVGDIFLEDGLKSIAFNEYFDTVVDDKIISKKSLNGIFLTDVLDITINEFDNYIDKYDFSDGEIQSLNKNRKDGKLQKYSPGTIVVYKDYILTAMSKFDENNKAVLTMPEYLGFLINFWDTVNRVYAQRSVSTPIFGSGITRIQGHKNISDEDLLKIMLWTFRISEMRFKHPAKLSIVIHEDKIDQINLLDIKFIKNGV